MSLYEMNTVEAFFRDQLSGGVTHHTAVGPGLARRNRQVSGLGWQHLSASNLPRQPQEVLVEDHLREALKRLNPWSAMNPDGVEGVLRHLRAIVLTSCDDDLAQASKKLTDLSLVVSNGGAFE